MEAESQQPKGRKAAISALNKKFIIIDLSRGVSNIPPAKASLGAIGALLIMLRDSMANKPDLVELGLHCADIGLTLDSVTCEKELCDLSEPMCDTINRLTTTVEEIQRKFVEWSKLDPISRFFDAKHEKEMIAAWKLDLDQILHVFNTKWEPSPSSRGNPYIVQHRR